LTLSQSGSWTPASSSGNFTDGSAEINATVSAGGWTSTSPGTGQGHITLIGAQDFLICHFKGAWQSSTSTSESSGFHIEVPQRLHVNNSNPIVAMNWGAEGIYTTSLTQNYAGGMSFLHTDGNTKKLLAQIRSPMGDYFNSTQFPSNVPNNFSTGRFSGTFFDVQSNKYLMSDIVLGISSASDNLAQPVHSALFVRLRRIKWTMPKTPEFQRLGASGEWLHTVRGIIWPWDSTVLKYNLFASGI
jgi:hypothetical protein